MDNPLQSVADTIAFDSKDWSLNHRDAWIYGIVHGWGNALQDVANQHKWSDQEVQRLKKLHRQWEKMKDA